MNYCIDCQEADNNLTGNFTDDDSGAGNFSKLVWCREKEAFVYQYPSQVRDCFKEKHLSCKCCGNISVVHIEGGYRCEDRYQVRCPIKKDCGARGPYKETKQEAIKAWEELNKED